MSRAIEVAARIADQPGRRVASIRAACECEEHGRTDLIDCYIVGPRGIQLEDDSTNTFSLRVAACDAELKARARDLTSSESRGSLPLNSEPSAAAGGCTRRA